MSSPRFGGRRATHGRSRARRRWSGSSRGVLGCWVSPRLVEYALQVLQALVTFPHTGPAERPPHATPRTRPLVKILRVLRCQSRAYRYSVVLRPPTGRRCAMATTAGTSTITETARAFFEACETGEGWEGCSRYCHPEAGFSAQAAPLADVRTLRDYT